MDNFVSLFLFACTLFTTISHGYCKEPPLEYWHTLSDFSQEKTRHCVNQSARERLLCEVEGALDAQAQPNYDLNNVKSLKHQLPANNRSCKFREENVYSLYPYSILPSPALNRVLEKYEAMHSRCLETDFASLDDLYTSNSTKPTCQYLIYRPSRAGFGNRIMALISSFMYAIMSARVLLLEYPEWGELFCEPFLSSTIQLPATTKLNQRRGPWYLEFRDAGCGLSTRSTNQVCNTTVVNMLLDHTTRMREYESVTCPVGYARLRNIPFVTVRESNQYFAPGYYLNPVVSRLLDLLFPRSNPFHLLSRFLLTPSDAMWGAISSNLDVQADRRIGVQVREQYAYYPVYDENILTCIRRQAGFLPRGLRRRVQAGAHFGLYMATLEKSHLRKADLTIRALMNESGVEFKLSFQRLDGREVHDKKHQQEALTDMWVLSMSHILITSQESTFGYVATGLGGVMANFLEKDAGKGCFIGLGFEPCFHAAPKGLSCTQDEPEPFSLHDMVQKTSQVKVCNDRPSGWTVVPSGDGTYLQTIFA